MGWASASPVDGRRPAPNGDVEPVVRRVLTPGAPADGAAALTGTWAGQADPVLLATVQPLG